MVVVAGGGLWLLHMGKTRGAYLLVGLAPHIESWDGVSGEQRAWDITSYPLFPTALYILSWDCGGLGAGVVRC